jgi:hypothetical protein
MKEYETFESSKEKLEKIQYNYNQGSFDYYVHDGLNRYLVDSAQYHITNERIILSGRLHVDNSDQKAVKLSFDKNERVKGSERKKMIKQVNVYLRTPIDHNESLISLDIRKSDLIRTEIYRRKPPILVVLGTIGGAGVLLYFIAADSFMNSGGGGINIAP